MNIIESNIANLPTKHGKFKIKAYKQGYQEHLAIMSENFENLDVINLRIHSECLTGDVFGSIKCDCQKQLELAIEYIAKNGGLIIYHRQEGRNIGLLNKVNAYSLQDAGKNTVEANLALGFREDEREYSIVEYIIKDLGIKKINVLTNNPAKMKFLEGLDVEIVERIPTIVEPNCYNKNYLNTKKEQLGHML
ncbi:GTP cyclohydrolase II [Aliarcobacter cibarius]|jgi:GTP cyclohydrolase II|uniref:GTP cyclohydrolase II n=1 Tax=Aliarcobacter cibarius TaxID=255507 RepID=A0A5J6RL50_9BACT|nr:GTP cyclohydrolase II [Aliarcobacter cibarius]QEZ89101.1 GTP cyclohydrolase II [Aliarcobacter cibarius]QKJ27121.1 GTP cyclohydrolase II [Aliarcobacter cibarius]TLS95364.1 GTP cyclohydrolase II [Aliarcobacter cibarius]TLS95762.1 GTP cyclohydrolase II [Aliarcobacter cibarius]TLT02607.1 GTP cyclohydrolase II [Aliarcobacter cibarius]